MRNNFKTQINFVFSFLYLVTFNLVFTIDDDLKNGAITDIVTIDYQLVYHGCPVVDFLYLIMPATDQEFRKAYLQQLKDLYHDSLGEFLTYFNLNVADIYPKEEFETQFKEKLVYGLMISIHMLPFLLVKHDDSPPDITQSELAGISFNTDNTYKDRIKGLVEDYIEWGYL